MHLELFLKFDKIEKFDESECLIETTVDTASLKETTYFDFGYILTASLHARKYGLQLQYFLQSLFVCMRQQIVSINWNCGWPTVVVVFGMVVIVVVAHTHKLLLLGVQNGTFVQFDFGIHRKLKWCYYKLVLCIIWLLSDVGRAHTRQTSNVGVTLWPKCLKMVWVYFKYFSRFLSKNVYVLAWLRIPISTNFWQDQIGSTNYYPKYQKYHKNPCKYPMENLHLPSAKAISLRDIQTKIDANFFP